MSDKKNFLHFMGLIMFKEQYCRYELQYEYCDKQLKKMFFGDNTKTYLNFMSKFKDSNKNSLESLQKLYGISSIDECNEQIEKIWSNVFEFLKQNPEFGDLSFKAILPKDVTFFGTNDAVAEFVRLSSMFYNGESFEEVSNDSLYLLILKLVHMEDSTVVGIYRDIVQNGLFDPSKIEDETSELSEQNQILSV